MSDNTEKAVKETILETIKSIEVQHRLIVCELKKAYPSAASWEIDEDKQVGILDGEGYALGFITTDKLTQIYNNLDL